MLPKYTWIVRHAKVLSTPHILLNRTCNLKEMCLYSEAGLMRTQGSHAEYLHDNVFVEEWTVESECLILPSLSANVQPVFLLLLDMYTYKIKAAFNNQTTECQSTKRNV